jgi:hypothetical protein
MVLQDDIDAALQTARDQILLAAMGVECLPTLSADGDVVAGYVNIAIQLRDIADLLCPPGKAPAEEGGATVYYLEQERSKRRLGH